MQFRIPVAILIFLGSYLPLSLILLALDFDYSMLSRPICLPWSPTTPACTFPLRNPAYSISIFLVCLMALAVTLFTLSLIKGKRDIQILQATYIPSDLMNYTLPYVVSFMSIEYHDTGKFVGLIIFLGWMFWITHRSGQIILNPALIAFGWRPYEVTYSYQGDTAQHNGIALADGRIGSGQAYKLAAVQDVLIVKVTADKEF